MSGVLDTMRSDIQLIDRTLLKVRRGEVDGPDARRRAQVFRNDYNIFEQQIRSLYRQPEERQEADGLLANYKVSLETLEAAANQRGSRRKTRRRGKKRATRKRRHA